MEEVRAQVHICLTTLLEQQRISTVDAPFALELAQVDPISPAQSLVAVRLLRRYATARAAYDLALPDEQAVLDWAMVHADTLGGDDLASEIALAGELAAHLETVPPGEQHTVEALAPGEVRNDVVHKSTEEQPVSRVSVQKERLVVEFPFHRPKVGALQPLKDSVEDWAFNREHRNEWSYPLVASWEVYQVLQQPVFADLAYSANAINAIKREFRREALMRQIQAVEERWRLLEQMATLEAVRPYIDGAPVANGQRLFRHQREAVQRMIEARENRFILAHDMGLGKAQPLTAKILTPTGWKLMGQITVGEEVINARGSISHVIGVFPQGEKDIYRVTFSDGSSTECCDEHLWHVKTPVQKMRGHAGKVVQLKDIMYDLRDAAGNCKYFIPMVQPVEFRERTLPLHPYLLGVLLGDGGMSRPSSVDVTSADRELLDEISQYLPVGVGLKQHGAPTRYRWALSIGNVGGESNPVVRALRELKLQGRKSQNKFIPSSYLFASVASRVALLQGLLDTDGCVRREDNNIEFSTSSPMLAFDIATLVQSLGGRAMVRNPCARFYTTPDGERHEACDAYRMSVILPPDIAPFRLPRKASIYQPRLKYQPSRAMIAVEYVGRKEAQCIAVDAPDHLYVTDDYILTHNTRSALIAAQAFGLPIWAVVPAGTIVNWQREAAAAGVSIQLHSWAKLPEPHEDEDYVLIVDEAHYAQTGEETVRGRGFLALADRARAVYMLSGTPMKNGRPVNLWPLLVAARHPLAVSKSAYEQRYCDPQLRSIGRKRAALDLSGARNLDELHELTRDVILYRKKKECIDLPDKLRVKREAEVKEAGRKLYQQTAQRLWDEHFQRMEDKRDALRAAQDTLLGEGVQESSLHLYRSEEAQALVELSIYRHAASLAKVDPAAELAQEALEEGQGVLLFTAFRESAERLASKLEADLLTGEVTKTRRQAMIDRFQSGESKVLVATIGAGGIGINLTAAQVVVMVDRAWTPGDTEQAEDRAYRIGQHQNVTSIWLQYGAIDEKIDQVLELKQERIDAVLQGRKKHLRGVPGVRALAKEIMESITTGKSLAELLGLEEADFAPPIVDLVRDPESEQLEQVKKSRPRRRAGVRRRSVKRDGTPDKRFKGLVTKIRMNIRVDEEVAAFLQSMKVDPQETTREDGYSGFLAEQVRGSEAFQRWQEKHKHLS